MVRDGIKWGDGSIRERTRQDGSVVHQVQWRDADTGKWRAKTFAVRDDAEDYLRDIGRAKRDNRYTPESTLTVSALVSAYIDRGRHRWTTNTVATYRLLAKQQIAPHLGAMRVAELTPARVQRWLDRLTTDLSPAVIENARTVLSGACREAVRLGALATNPVDGTRPPTRRKRPTIVWTADDVARVLAHTRNDVRLHARYLVALTTGVRPGELRAMQWQDFDFDAGVVHVRRSMTRGEDYRHIVGETTKTQRNRSIALPTETMDALRRLLQDQRKRRLAASAWNDRDIIFDRGDGTPLAQQTVANQHRQVCESAGVPRIRVHDLRHTAATLLLRAGTHPKVVADILGHSSISTTLDLYSHVDVSMQRTAIETLADVVSGRTREA